jgi:bifunctional DNase/RNase
MAIVVKVAGLALDDKSKAPIVVLKDDAQDRILPIVIGILEASSIAAQLEGVEFPRPMTHDLITALLNRVEAQIVEVEITDIVDETFYALIHVRHGQALMSVDSRPSDAIALALRAGAPITVRADVFEKTEATGHSAHEPHSHDEADGSMDELLQSLEDEDFGKYKM